MDESINLGNGDNLVLRMLGSPERTILGEGGYGKVITTPKNEGLALKISKDVDMCREWSREYDIQKRVYDNYNSARKSVRIVEPVKFAFIEEDRCYILMQRVCPPENLPQNQAVHALLGDIRGDNVYAGRGRFIGQSLLEKYMDLERLAKDLGIFLAVMHFKLGLDALDLEYILGRRCGTDRGNWVNVIDFGMVGEYDRERASDSIIDVAYFPLEQNCDYEECTPQERLRNEKLSESFRTSYIKEAEKYGKAEEAEEVLRLVEI